MVKIKVLKHRFLVAMPTLADTNFTKSVVYLHEHSDQGALGIIINKPLEINLGKVLDHLNIQLTKDHLLDLPVLMGGPVGQEHGFILYNDKVKHHPLVSASKEMLETIAKGEGPEEFLVALGYSGWGKGQLEKEIARNDWLVAPYDHKLLFDTPIEKRWKDAAALIGIDIHQLSNQVGHA